MTGSGTKAVRPVLAVIFLTLIVFSALSPGRAFAVGQLTSRSLTLQAGGSDGGSKPGGVVNHLFGFTPATSTNIGSIQFLYCTTAAGTCTMPTGLVTTSATLGSATGTGSTFTSIVATTNGAPYISRTASSLGITPITETLQSITNPTTTNQTFYVRITTFTSTNATAGATDAGTVAASTATQIVLTGTMPESLVFCAGGTVGTTSGVPDCTTATSGAISFNQLFSPTDTATATSQMAASTNAGTGYIITVNGATLTSGSNTVTALNTASVGHRGTSQFGLNVMANTTTTSTPAVGVVVTPAANGTNYKGQALTGYSTADSFKFTTGDSVANSANSPSDAQIYTASYIVNVNGAQAVGTYTTTLTYICTPTY